MKPFCIRCGEVNPSPMLDEDGDLIYWFRLVEDEDGTQHLYLDSEDGIEGSPEFTCITDKTFDFDGSYGVMCSSCAMEECDYIHGEIVDDGLDEDGWMSEGFDPFADLDLNDDPLDFGDGDHDDSEDEDECTLF